MIGRPVGSGSIWCPLLESELDDLTCLEIDLEDVGSGSRGIAPLIVQCGRALVVKLRVVHPLRIERDYRVYDGSVAADHQDFFASIRVQQDKVCPWLDLDGIFDFWQ